MELKTYESAKFALAEVLRALVAKAPRGSDAVSRGAPELFARLAEDRFNLLVAGRFSRGKSSLMNALLGVDRLPTGILPLTSVITAVSYGSQEKVWITPDGGRMPYDIPLEKLRDYLTEDGNPGNRRRVSLARIELPVELLRRGFHFVDSPGLGSAIAANTKTTQAFLPQADAVMLVSGFEAPLGAEEDAIVAWVAQARVPLYIVLNKQDTVTREARDQVVQYVQRHVQERWTGPVPQVFPLSARDALVAKLTRDEVGLERSGLPALEAELTRFLLEDKARVLIAGLCERVRQLMDASTMPVSLVGPLRERLESLERHFSGETRRHTGGTAPRPTRPFEPDEVVRIAECRLCAEVSRQVFNDLCQYQYELATFAEAGQALAAAQGLCAAHTRLYVGLATDHNVCFALTPLFKRLTAVLQEGSASALLATQARCRSCSLQARVEEAVIQAWLHSSEEPAEWGGICLPHLRTVARHPGAQGRVSRWSRHQAKAVERLVEDMQRYVLKRDALRRSLTTKEETDAAARALAFLAAHRVVVVRDESCDDGAQAPWQRITTAGAEKVDVVS